MFTVWPAAMKYDTPTTTMISARERIVPLMPAGFWIIPKTAQKMAAAMPNTRRK